jgi:hypothetical protein
MLPLEPKTQIEKQAEQKQEYKHIGSIKLKRGHYLFKFNIQTKELTSVEIERRVGIGLDKQPVKENKVLFEKDCIYIGALNKKNAYKKLIKIYNERDTSIAK